VSATARRHGLSPALLFTWRRLAREGRLQTDDEGSFARAVIAAEGRWNEPALAAGRIEIVLANGLRVIVDRQVDAVALTRVLGVVARQ
jgi:transposase